MWLLHYIAYTLLGLSALIAVFNFYLMFLRYPVHRLRGGRAEDFRFVSGVPIVGTILVVMAGILGPKDGQLLWPAVAILVLDTGGVPWALALLALYFARHRTLPWRP